MNTFTSKEKEVVGVLSFGTFLEYFDFWLYIHLATTLNSVFFAQGDAKNSALLTSYAYVMSFVFRPISAIILGYVGDKYGRTFVIKTMFTLMGLVCISIFLLPSYQDIGVMASFGITFLRIIQGISTMGEIVGGEIYLCEYLKGRKAFIGVGCINFVAMIGCQCALGGVYLALNGYFDWRYLFLAGLVVFIFGFPMRRNLTESMEFMKGKVGRQSIVEDKLPKLFYFFMLVVESTNTIVTYVSLIAFNNILRDEYGFTELEVTVRNMDVKLYNMIAFGICFSLIIFTRLSPYVVALTRNILGIVFIIFTPFLLDTKESVILAQTLLALLCCLNICMFNPIIYKNIPINIRFKTGAMMFAAANALAIIFVSFGLILAKPYLGDYTILAFTLPPLICYVFALRYFAKIDMANPNGILRNYKEVY